MNVVASSPEGLEKSLAEEISNLGGFNINTYKRFINFRGVHVSFFNPSSTNTSGVSSTS